MRRRVVITGRAVVSPLAVGVDAHWQALVDGRSAMAQVDRLTALGLDVSRGATVSAELIQPHLTRLPRKQQKLYNRATLLGMLAASLAMEDAGLAAGAGDPLRFGVRDPGAAQPTEHRRQSIAAPVVTARGVADDGDVDGAIELARREQ